MFQGEEDEGGINIIVAVKILQKGCQAYLDNMMDSQAESHKVEEIQW